MLTICNFHSSNNSQIGSAVESMAVGLVNSPECDYRRQINSKNVVTNKTLLTCDLC